MIRSRFFPSLAQILTLGTMATGLAFAGDPTKTKPAQNEAEKLVQLALKAEVRGNQDERNKLIEDAVDADPSFAPARWHRGQVQMDAKKGEQGWLSIEEAEQKATSNALLAEYDKMRRSLMDDAAGNETLATWCMRRGLKERAKVHWARVLKFQPGHKTAVKRLGLKQFEGRWLTREQIARVKQHKIQTTKLNRKWIPTLTKWRRIFQSKDSAAKEQAKKELKSAATRELVGLMETQLSGNDQTLSLAVVDAIAQVKDQVATESLVRHAALSKWSSVRSSATEHLKSRSPHGYVPILIDAMMSPYEFQSWSVRSPLDDDHVLALNYSVGQKGKHSDQLLQGSVNFLGGRDDDRAEEIQEELKERIEKMNEDAERFNKPIRQALTQTTGQDLGSDPSQWNDWWNDYNEYQVPEFRPVFTSFRRPSTVIIATQPFSCFPAGILVSTQTGLRPIEKIRVGDYVLSQEAQTGELAYKPVLETTVRKSDAIMNVTMNGEDLRVTRGHPMWVNGRQWQMAKQLRRGDFLHSIRGPVRVDETQLIGSETNVYNLVVAEFGTYFVGNSRVLVHDNSLYVPPGGSVPGDAKATQSIE